jgi:hypothetical protein
LGMLAVGTTGLAVAAILGIVASGSVPRPAAALPIYAQQTNLPCSQCHVNPAGGKDLTLTDFGKEFQANGDKLPQ